MFLKTKKKILLIISSILFFNQILWANNQITALTQSEAVQIENAIILYMRSSLSHQDRFTLNDTIEDILKSKPYLNNYFITTVVQQNNSKMYIEALFDFYKIQRLNILKNAKSSKDIEDNLAQIKNFLIKARDTLGQNERYNSINGNGESYQQVMRKYMFAKIAFTVSLIISGLAALTLVTPALILTVYYSPYLIALNVITYSALKYYENKVEKIERNSIYMLNQADTNLRNLIQNLQ